MRKNSGTETFDSQAQNHPRRLKLLHLQLIAFNLSGILPPASISGKRWKTFLYETFTAVSLIWFLPAIAVQLVGLYVHLDDIVVVTAILFQVSCYISTGIIFFYFVWNRTELVRLFEALERDFIAHMDKVGSPVKREAILKEASRKSAIITWTLLGLCFTVEIAWGCIPCILGYIEYLTDTVPADLANDRGRYFGLAMWLPENVNKSPTYELMHLFHFIAVYTVVSNITGCYMLMFAFAFHTTTQFKLLCAAFEDVDDSFKKSELSGCTTENRSQREYTTKKEPMDDFESLEAMNYNSIPGRINENTPLDDGNIQISNPGYLPAHKDERSYGGPSQNMGTGFNHPNWQSLKLESSLQETTEQLSSRGTRTGTPANFQNRAGTEVQPSGAPSDEFLQQYLTDCIKYHQHLIKFSTDMNNFLSPVVLIFFVFSEAMMCLSTFQLALGQADERSFKFFTSVILACIWPLMVCMYGDDLMEQSLAVKGVAFGCRWYNNSQSFNKLLHIVMMRAEKPIKITAGKFYIVSLATFADIGNKVYAYFTLLKRMNEE